jgi:hypothetical protein
LQILSYGQGDPNLLVLFPNDIQTNNSVVQGTVQISGPGAGFTIDNFLPSDPF